MLQVRKPGYRRIRQPPSKKPGRLDDDVDAMTLELIYHGAIEPRNNRACESSSCPLKCNRADDLDRRQPCEFRQFLVISAGFRKQDRGEPAFLMGIKTGK